MMMMMLPFPQSNSPKENFLTQMDFELANFESAVRYVNHILKNHGISYWKVSS